MQIKSIFSTALVAAVALAQADTSSMNLTSVLSSNKNLTTLTKLLSSMPDFASQVANMINITIFAPSDAAFGLLNASDSESLTQLASNPDAIQALLMYHVLPKEVMAANVSTTPAFLNAALNNTKFANVTGGQVVEVRLMGTTVQLTSGLKSVSNVTQADVKYNNGVVHIIDNLLTIPANDSTTAAAANLTALIGALKLADLVTALDGASDVTIFAPSNAAFNAIGSALTNLTKEDAAKLLEYHVINGTIAYSSSLTNASVPTMNGANLTITVNNSTGEVFVNSARVINADILVSNGVMHVLDNVLNPANMTNATSPDVPVFSGASSVSQNPLTSGQPSATTTNTALQTTESAPVQSYSSQMAPGGSAGSTGALAPSSTKGAAVPAATGAMGAAALFGGAAVVANW